jgi:hypothetical protein
MINTQAINLAQGTKSLPISKDVYRKNAQDVNPAQGRILSAYWI